MATFFELNGHMLTASEEAVVREMIGVAESRQVMERRWGWIPG